MFEDVDVEDLIAEIAAHDFDADPPLNLGAARIDAIAAYERVIRTARARQLGLLEP